MPRPDYIAILRELTQKQVDFIVIGGVGAVLQGAPITTFDLDILHSTEEPNIIRLQAALESLDAYYRAQPERRLRPQASHLASAGHQLLITRFGPLDVLGSVGNRLTYRDLIRQTAVLQVAENLTVPVLGLASLIALKEQTGGEKDRAVLPILRRTLEEKDKSSTR